MRWVAPNNQDAQYKRTIQDTILPCLRICIDPDAQMKNFSSPSEINLLLDCPLKLLAPSTGNLEDRTPTLQFRVPSHLFPFIPQRHNGYSKFNRKDDPEVLATLSTIDVVFITCAEGMLALPFLTAHDFFSGRILVTEPVLEAGRQQACFF